MPRPQDPARPDQYRALGLSTFAFTISFAVWTLFSIIGVQIKEDLGLSDTQFGLLVATPVLTGSVSRMFLGIWTEKYGGRIVFPLQMLTTALAVWMLTWAQSYPMFLLAALGLGLAGGSFIIGVSYVSRWFGAGQQGTALGIFGAGNVGAALTSFVAPVLLVAFGWEGTVHIYAVALALTAALFYAFAKPDPVETGQAAIRPATGLRAQLAPLKYAQVWRFSLYYFFVFGAFVALASFLPRFYVGAYGLELTVAGSLAGLYALPGSVFRALGGWMSDKWGARRIMYATFLSGLALLVAMSYSGTPLALFVTLTVILGFSMSLGKGAVYKHIPVYYPQHVGAVGGLVSMIGGLGGFVLPIAFGGLLDMTGLWTAPFILLALLVSGLTIWMHLSVRKLEQRNSGLPNTA